MSRMVPPEAFVVFLITAFVGGARAEAQTTWYVDDDAPGDPGPGDPGVSDPLEDGSAAHPFDAIDEGLGLAADGDEVLMRDGTYTGSGNRDIDFPDRLITLRSEHGPDTCIIDVQGSESDPHFGLTYTGCPDAGATFEGFTITGGYHFTGGMYIYDGCHPTIIDCRFTYNNSEKGGGMYVGRNSDPVLVRCEFIDNYASNDGGGMYIVDGSNCTIIDCRFSGNTAVDDGGGIYNWFGSAPLLVNSAFHGNYGGEGGAIYSIQSSEGPVLINCLLSGNSALHGGAMQTNEGAPTLTHCTITDNTASESGGGFRNISTTALQLTNCIIWGNSGDQIEDNDWSTTIVRFSDISGGWGDDGNIDADPRFVDPDGGDDDPHTYEDNDYTLAGDSPCIDAADNDAVPSDTADLDGDGDLSEPIPLDLHGHARIVDDPDTIDTGNPGALGPPIGDMGAYEFQPIEVGCAGDSNSDGIVDPLDIGFILSRLGCPVGPGESGCDEADVNSDGVVDPLDLGFVSSHFGACPE